MADAFTNRGLVLQVTASNPGVWGTDLNVNAITITDAILGATLGVVVGGTTVNLTQSQSQNLAFQLTGALSADVIITFPLNFNSATVAVGGFFIFDNQSTGNHSVTVKTVASGSTGVVAPQNKAVILYSDGTNVKYANSGGYAGLKTYPGNPNGLVTGNAGNAATGQPVDELWDSVNKVFWVSNGDGVGGQSGTVWVNDQLSSGGFSGVLGISQGGTGNTTAAGARGPTGLNIDQLTLTSANASYAILATDRNVGSTATAMTGNNIWTLPAANTVNPGQLLRVMDINGVVGTFTLTVARSASDSINGATSVVINTQYGEWDFISDGVSKWDANAAGVTYTASHGITLVGTDFQLDFASNWAVGSTGLFIYQNNDTVGIWSSTAGSNLYAANINVNGTAVSDNVAGHPPGTWKNISGTIQSLVNYGLWQRTS